MALIYSNHAGTLSESFAIGKRGIKLLQGTGDPTGVTAPTGSLYVRSDETTNRVFQIDATGTWTSLIRPDDILAGTGIAVDIEDGQVTISRTAGIAIPTKYKQTFTSSDLVDGVLTITHDLEEDFPLVQVYDNTRTTIIPDYVTTSDSNVLALGLAAFGAIAGTWSVTVISS